MKLLKYLALGSALAISMTACNDWLDVNVDPDSPNNESILIQNRVPWLLKEYTYSAGVANIRSGAICGAFYSTNGNMNSVGVKWAGAAGLTTTPYQTWFVGAASNINDLYNRASKEGAYHYMAVADVIHAMGFMEMLDLYGEMPYEEALSESPAPGYSDGKTIFWGCMDKIDEAIELFSKDQDPTAAPLSAGDIWNGGDVQKWIKLCYGLKARWLLRLSKKAEFDADAILAALAKAPQSNADDSRLLCYDVDGDLTDFLLGDPIMTNGNWDTGAYGKTQWFSKFHYDLLSNMRGAGVVDPRLSKIVPASMTNVTMDSNGRVLNYEWRRGKGVDIYGDAERLVAGGAASIAVQSFALEDKALTYEITDGTAKTEFVDNFKAQGYTEVASSEGITGRQIAVDGDNVTVCYPTGAFFVNVENYIQAGDTAYVNLNSGSANTNNGAWGMPAKDMYYHTNDKAAALAGAISGTGSFQLRPNSDFDLVTYYEMCFIKAEVLMRKGDTAGALAAYKAGIQANIERMQSKLTTWQAEGYDNPDMWPMDATEISDYLSSDAVCQNAGQLTMADIMLQKYVAMGFSIETYNDMRRFNFSAGNIGNFGVVYPGYDRTKLFAGASSVTGTSKDSPFYWIRRWRLPATLELSYNQNNALAMNPHALDDDIWQYPVWWDCATDAEYESYLK